MKLKSAVRWLYTVIISILAAYVVNIDTGATQPSWWKSTITIFPFLSSISLYTFFLIIIGILLVFGLIMESELISSLATLIRKLYLLLLNKRNIRVWDDCPRGRSIFGRRVPMGLLRSALKRGNICIVVVGESGIGKTALVAEAIRAIHNRFGVIIWHCFLYTPSMESLIEKSLEALGLSPEGTWGQKLSHISNRLGKKPFIFILDSVEAVAQNEHNLLDHFLQTISSVDKCSIVITSTSPIEDISDKIRAADVSQIHLTGLDGASLKNLALKHYNTKIDSKTINLLSNELNGNPQLVRILFNIAQSNQKVPIDNLVSQILECSSGEANILFDRQMRYTSQQDLSLLLMFCLWRRPISQQEVIDWFPMASSSSIDIHDFSMTIERIKRNPLIQETETNTLSLSGFALAQFTNFIQAKLSSHLRGEEDWPAVNQIALAHAHWPEHIRISVAHEIANPTILRISHTGHNATSIKQLIIDALNRSLPTSPFAVANWLFLLRRLDDSPITLDLSGRSLRGADFRLALLFNSNLKNTSLQNAVFSDVNGPIYAVAANPKNDDQLAVALRSGALEIRSTYDGKTIYRNTGVHSQPARFIKYTSDGEHVVSGGEDGAVIIWNYQTSTSKVLHSSNGWIWDGDIFGDMLLTAGSTPTINLFDLTKYTLVQQIPSPSKRLWCIRLWGDLLVVAGDDKKIYATKVRPPEFEIKSHLEWRVLNEVQAPIKSMDCKNTNLAYGLSNGEIHICTNKNGTLDNHRITAHRGTVRTVSWLSDKELVSSGDDGIVKITSIVENNVSLKSLSETDSRIWKLSCSGHSTRSIFSVGDDRAIRKWQPDRTSFPTMVRSGYGPIVKTIDKFKAELIVTCGDDFLRFIHVNNLDSKEIKIIRRNARIQGAIYLRENLIVACLDTGELAFVEKIGVTWESASVRFIDAHLGPIESLELSPCHSMFATAGEDRFVRIWNIHGDLLYDLGNFHTSRIWSISFIPDGSGIVTAGGDFNIAWWSFNSKQPYAVGKGHDNLILGISHHGATHLVSGGTDGTIRVWDNGVEICQHYIRDIIRNISTFDDIIVAVGRSSDPKEGWTAHIGSSENISNLKRIVISKAHGSARAQCLINKQSIIIGGDSSDLMRIGLQSGRVLDTGRTVGPYEGTEISSAASGMSGQEIQALTLLGANVYNNQ